VHAGVQIGSIGAYMVSCPCPIVPRVRERAHARRTNVRTVRRL